MASAKPEFIALPAGQVLVLHFEEQGLLEALRDAREQIAFGRYACALLVRASSPPYCVLDSDDIESLLTHITEPGASRAIEAAVTWRDGTTDPDTALHETAIEVDGSIVAVAVAAGRRPEVAMATPADDVHSAFEAIPMAAPAASPVPQPTETTAKPSFTRTPHIDVDQPEPVRPGQTLAVNVYLDTGDFRPGEHGERTVIEGEEALIDVYLYTTPHFRVLGSSQEKLFVERSKPKSAQLAFSLEVRSAAEIETDPAELDPGQGTISAFFMHTGRPCGRVHRSVALAGDAPATGT
ncbi:MAG: hypothetical protein OES09_05880, partial [Gammaproteobacteria bacterium]|nr:hypothetical protein [Gammaproteobacteria bacterium]